MERTDGWMTNSVVTVQQIRLITLWVDSQTLQLCGGSFCRRSAQLEIENGANSLQNLTASVKNGNLLLLRRDSALSFNGRKTIIDINGCRGIVVELNVCVMMGQCTRCKRKHFWPIYCKIGLTSRVKNKVIVVVSVDTLYSLVYD